MKKIIKAMLIAKQARLRAMEPLIYNTALQLECQFLRAEISALEKELYSPRVFNKLHRNDR